MQLIEVSSKYVDWIRRTAKKTKTVNIIWIVRSWSWAQGAGRRACVATCVGTYNLETLEGSARDWRKLPCRRYCKARLLFVVSLNYEYIDRSDCCRDCVECLYWISNILCIYSYSQHYIDEFNNYCLKWVKIEATLIIYRTLVSNVVVE